MFPAEITATCQAIIAFIGPTVITGITNKWNSDKICAKLSVCEGFTQCKLHSKPSMHQISGSSRTHLLETIEFVPRGGKNVQPLETIEYVPRGGNMMASSFSVGK
jgi:hypothetical protein